MGACKFCGQDAGFLKTAHEACTGKLTSAITTYLRGNGAVAELDTAAKGIGANAANARDVFMPLWDGAVVKALDDGVLTAEEEDRLMSAARLFGYGQPDLDKKGQYTHVVRAAILRDVLEGKIPERVKVEGLTVNLQKTEKIAYVFQGVEYHTLRTIRLFSGVSHGLSIRVMKGVYYRPSVFKGTPVENTQVVSGGKGTLAATNKNLYFIGPLKSMRIPYAKIITFQPYSDGIGIQRDAASAKPEVFKTGDGWFAYNLITNLAAM